MMKSLAVLAGLLFVPALSANATTLLSSDFNSQTSTDGASAFTGISWSNVGLTAASSLDLSAGAAVQRDGAIANLSSLAVARNIDTAGPWYVDIDITTDTGNNVLLDSLTFDYYFINNGGIAQSSAHANSGVFTLSILDASNTVLNSAQVGPMGTSDPASNQGAGVMISFGSSVLLQNNTNYTLRFTASSQSSLGNNVAVDNFSFSGSLSPVSTVSVPEPASVSLLLAGLGLIGTVARRRRQH